MEKPAGELYEPSYHSPRSTRSAVRRDGLITEAEFEVKRKELMSRQW